MDTASDPPSCLFEAGAAATTNSSTSNSNESDKDNDNYNNKDDHHHDSTNVRLQVNNLLSLFDLSGDNERENESFVLMSSPLKPMDANLQLTCPLEANPQVEQYHWSYVTLDQFVSSLVSEFQFELQRRKRLRNRRRVGLAHDLGYRRQVIEKEQQQVGEEGNDYKVNTNGEETGDLPLANVSKQTDYATKATKTPRTTTRTTYLSSNTIGNQDDKGNCRERRGIVKRSSRYSSRRMVTNEPEVQETTQPPPTTTIKTNIVAHLRNKLNDLASRVHLTTSSSRIKLAELISGRELLSESRVTSSEFTNNLDGLVVLCRGSNRVGKQVVPCASILMSDNSSSEAIEAAAVGAAGQHTSKGECLLLLRLLTPPCISFYLLLSKATKSIESVALQR